MYIVFISIIFCVIFLSNFSEPTKNSIFQIKSQNKKITENLEEHEKWTVWMEVRKKNAKNLLLYPIEKFFQMYLTSKWRNEAAASEQNRTNGDQQQPHGWCCADDVDDDERLIVVFNNQRKPINTNTCDDVFGGCCIFIWFLYVFFPNNFFLNIDFESNWIWITKCFFMRKFFVEAHLFMNWRRDVMCWWYIFFKYHWTYTIQLIRAKYISTWELQGLFLSTTSFKISLKTSWGGWRGGWWVFYWVFTTLYKKHFLRKAI